MKHVLDNSQCNYKFKEKQQPMEQGNVLHVNFSRGVRPGDPEE